MIQQTIRFLGESLRHGFIVAVDLLKIIVPVIAIIKLLDLVGATGVLAAICGPVMAVLGLPDETGIVFATGLLTGIYGALSAIAALSSGELSFTVAQATVLASLLLFAHGLPIEARVAERVGVKLWFTILYRIGNGLFFAWLLAVLFDGLGLLQQTAVIHVAADTALSTPDLPTWAIGQLVSLAKMTVIILALVFVLDLFKLIRLEQWLKFLLSPILRLIGIAPQATMISIVGIMLGISYGGGLIMREAKSGTVGPRDVIYTMVLLSLAHSLIEDTALMLLIGADFVVILVGRIVYAGVATALFIAITRSMSANQFRRLFICSN